MEYTNKKFYQSWWGRIIIFFGTLVLIVIIALVFYFINLVKQYKSEDYQYKKVATEIINNKYSSDAKKLIEGQNNYWLGSANAKIIIVEFADFNCPLCENSYSKIREISVKYKNNVKITYRDFPNQENSINKAMAARCAGEQGLFWLMHDKLFQNQSVSDNTTLASLAEQIGADSKKFTDCLNSSKYLQAIQKDYSDAESLGVKGTPTWFINGYKIEGDIPYDIFTKIIGELVK